jgi:hypothetical protein
MPASIVAQPARPTGSAAALPTLAQPLLLRALLLAGCLAAVAFAAAIGRPGPALAADFELARLLRGMAIIKGCLAGAAVAVLLWRFGQPLSRRMAGAYLIGAWLAAGAAMLVWQLTLIPLAALAFHAGEITMLVTAWRDRGSVRLGRGT